MPTRGRSLPSCPNDLDFMPERGIGLSGLAGGRVGVPNLGVAHRSGGTLSGKAGSMTHFKPHASQ